MTKALDVCMMGLQQVYCDHSGQLYVLVQTVDMLSTLMHPSQVVCGFISIVYISPYTCGCRGNRYTFHSGVMGRGITSCYYYWTRYADDAQNMQACMALLPQTPHQQ